MAEGSRLPVVIGVDVGGTSSTVAVLSPDGAVAAAARGGGANLRSSTGELSTTLRKLLTETVATARARTGRAPEVIACLAGVSGAGPAGRDRVVTMVDAALAPLGPRPGVVEVVTDPVVAFAAGSENPDGALLLAGTGAVAARFSAFEQAQRCDGLGWVLGDTGSGVWLALEGLRAAAAELDGRGPATALTAEARALADAVGPSTGDPRQDLVRVLDVHSPAKLGRFAPVVSRCAADGDAVAVSIVQRAVTALLHTLSVVDRQSPAVVLAGSVLTNDGPVRGGVLAELGDRVRDAGPPVVGALRLAAQRAGWAVPEPAGVRAGVEAALRSAADGGGQPTSDPAGDGPLAIPPAATGRGETGLVVDRYRPEDRPVLYDICLRTGDSGGDATALYRHGELLGHNFLGAYLEREPDLVRVLRGHDGTPVGYSVATADTTAFEQWCEERWWPALRARYPLPDEGDDSPDAGQIRRLHEPPRTNAPWLVQFPAHLHIDIVPEGQGGGNGRRLIESVLDAVAQRDVPGIHLGVGGRNVRAIGFYEHIGFRVLEHGATGLVMGLRLPRP